MINQRSPQPVIHLKMNLGVTTNQPSEVKQ